MFSVIVLFSVYIVISDIRFIKHLCMPLFFSAAFVRQKYVPSIKYVIAAVNSTFLIFSYQLSYCKYNKYVIFLSLSRSYFVYYQLN